MTDGRYRSNKIEPGKLVDIRREEKREKIIYLGIECGFLSCEGGKRWDSKRIGRRFYQKSK